MLNKDLFQNGQDADLKYQKTENFEVNYEGERVVNYNASFSAFYEGEITSAATYVKAYVKDLLENSDEGKFSIISHGRGKYGRVLGELFVKGHEKSVNELLKENGHAYEYHGEKKKVFGSWYKVNRRRYWNLFITVEKKSWFTKTKL